MTPARDGLTAPTAPALSSELAPLLQRLAAARNRGLADLLLQAGLFAAAIGLATFAAVNVGSWLAPSRLAGLNPLLLGGAAAALALLVGGGIAVLRRVPLVVVARRADALFGLQERASAALEVMHRGAANPLERALVSDAAARAGAVVPAHLMPSRWPRSAVSVAVTGLLAGLLVVFPLPEAPSGAGAGIVESAVVMDEPVRADVVTALRHAAESMAEDARRREDPFLAAVAREFAKLEEAVSDGVLTDSAQLQGDLERLLHYSAEGYRRAGEVAGAQTDLSRVVERALQALEPFSRGELASMGGVNAPRPEMTAGADDAPQIAPQASAGDLYEHAVAGAAGGGALPGALLAGERSVPSETGVGTSQECVQDDDVACYMISRPNEAQSIVAEAAGDQAASGIPGEAQGGQIDNGFLLGPAPQSGSGESYEAGRGAQGIGGGLPSKPELFIVGEQVAFQNVRVAGEGASFRLELPPAVEPQELRPGGSVDRKNWKKLPERAVGRALLAPGQREVIARYFLPGQD